MKVVQINTSSIGGAAKAAINLHLGLLNQGIDSVYLYHNGPEIDIPSAIRIEAKFTFLDKLLFKSGLRLHYWDQVAKVTSFKKNKNLPFTISYTDFDILKSNQAALILNADIIHLHWITNCINYQTFFKALSKPIFWTLHDMNPFTGGCHYDNACVKYEVDCSDCPQLNMPEAMFAAKEELTYKKKVKNKGDLHIVSLNEWMQKKASASSLLCKYNHYIIPNSINTDVFNLSNISSVNKTQAKKRIGYVATYHSELKGSDIFLAIVELYKNSSDIEFVYIGNEYDIDMENCRYKGNLKSEDELAAFYRSIDLLIVPSRGDNLPNVILEAICCGTPVYASNIGGIPSMITNHNGKLISENTVDGWKQALNEFVSTDFIYDPILISAQAIAAYNRQQQTFKMLNLYKNSLLNGTNPNQS